MTTCLYLNSYFCLLGVVGAAHPWSAIQGDRGLPSGLAGGRERGGKSWSQPREERESNLLQGSIIFSFLKKKCHKIDVWMKNKDVLDEKF